MRFYWVRSLVVVCFAVVVVAFCHCLLFVTSVEKDIASTEIHNICAQLKLITYCYSICCSCKIRMLSTKIVRLKYSDGMVSHQFHFILINNNNRNCNLRIFVGCNTHPMINCKHHTRSLNASFHRKFDVVAVIFWVVYFCFHIFLMHTMTKQSNKRTSKQNSKKNCRSSYWIVSSAS